MHQLLVLEKPVVMVKIHGMIRQHQFHEVELVSVVEPKKCLDELERM